MLNFDETRFLSIQSGAVALAPRLDAAIAGALAAGTPNIHFLGTGGGAILMRPAVQFLRRRSAFPVFDDFKAELLVLDSRNLTRGSIVVIPSLLGTTQENVAMMELAQSRGAHRHRARGPRGHAARNGAEAQYFGAVGTDLEGELTRHVLAAQGVGVEGLVTRAGGTSVTEIEVGRDGERRILREDFGACRAYVPSPSDLERILVADHVHIGWLGDGGALRRLPPGGDPCRRTCRSTSIPALRG